MDIVVFKGEAYLCDRKNVYKIQRRGGFNAMAYDRGVWTIYDGKEVSILNYYPLDKALTEIPTPEILDTSPHIQENQNVVSIDFAPKIPVLGPEYTPRENTKQAASFAKSLGRFLGACVWIALSVAFWFSVFWFFGLFFLVEDVAGKLGAGFGLGVGLYQTAKTNRGKPDLNNPM